MSDGKKIAASSIVLEATQRQRMASDPLVSSWVGASAGSGKTKVLTDRILRLLLPREDGRPGTPPQKILALTFTKAGANEMALRLSRKLSAWAVMSEEKLSRDIEDNLLGRAPTALEIESARKLFARVVDAPGGLNIMTIHSFCQSILGRFPIEAGLPPHFKPLEEEEARELLDASCKTILSHAGTNAGSPQAQAVADISTAMTEDQFMSLIQNLMGERNQMISLLKRTFGIEGLYTALCAQLSIRPGLTEDEALTAFCTLEDADAAGLRQICAALSGGSATDKGKAIALQAFLDADVQTRMSLYATYRKIFLKDEGDIRERLATTAVQQADPYALTIMTAEAERLQAFEETRKAIATASLTRSLFIIGQAILDAYQTAKEARGVLDFDDLILKTLSLLKGEVNTLNGLQVTPWILYKLDEGIDHILVDEAQDTNPEQWDIIRALTDDFFSGAGASDDVRTLFVVGDKKQSIFSFQRAEPKKFDEMHRWFDKKIRESGSTFLPVDINTSFRSVRTVLAAVDAVFAPERGLMAQDYLSHIARREGQAGIVEVWPVYRTESDTADDENESVQTPAPAGWTLPDSLRETESGSQKMAAKIGDMIKLWLENKEQLASYNREIRPGDILVLVRSRNAFVGQLVRALKVRGIPVSGVDRMILGEQMVVQDMATAAKFALLPDDDLTLACLLKSPFIGMSEEDLYVFAQGRSTNLWNSIVKNGDGLIVSWLEKLIERAGSLHPYEFFSRLVQEPCPANEVSGMRAIRARLGEDALDPLDEFLNLAMTYENSHSAGLQGFLHWHEAGSSEIKRQMEEAASAVRIMTVHGAKGLQAPIVFLPDTIRTAQSVKTDKILWPQKTGGDIPFYAASRKAAPGPVCDAMNIVERQMDEEYRRLLYVAMTRAEERLYIGGYMGKRAPSANGKTAYWYDDIRGAFEAIPGIEREESGVADKDGNDIPLLRLSHKATAAPDKQAKDKEATAEKLISLPSWALRPAPAEPFPPRPLTPSRPADPEPAAASPLAASQEYRFKRGNATHKLLQILPELPESARRIAAEKFLARAALALPPTMQKEIADEIMAILEDPDFGAIFGAGSLAEIPVTGLLRGHTLVSGQIDRILVTEDDILIIDFKTNRPPPQKLADVPVLYKNQLKIYADVLRAAYPGKAIRAALLWTDGAQLMEIPV